tara:strand:+ start:10421 stop:10624 length:204 start_codon:yes stop_codon:yes gene_type:complete
MRQQIKFSPPGFDGRKPFQICGRNHCLNVLTAILEAMNYLVFIVLLPDFNRIYDITGKRRKAMEYFT